MIENKKYIELGNNAKDFALKFHWDKIVNEYNRISLSLFTHDSNGITEKDFTLAKEIDALEE